MKKIRFIIIIILVIFMSGCEVKSNVKIDEFGKVKEEVVFVDSIKNLGGTKEKANSTLEEMVNKYLVALNSRGYKYKISVDKNNGKVTINNEYDNINDYFKKTIFSQYVYRQMKWEENDLYYEITNVTDHITYCDDCSDWPVLPYVEVNFSLPTQATEQNADKQNNNNTYTWIYDKNTPSDKKFYLKISKSALKESEEKHLQEEKNKKRKKNIFTASVVIGVLVVLSFSVLCNSSSL